jgi:hypothetical protein
MVLCGEVWVDPDSGKKSLLGVFSQVRATEFPVTAPPLCIYVALTDGRSTMELPREGEYRFRLECNGDYVIETRLQAINGE